MPKTKLLGNLPIEKLEEFLNDYRNGFTWEELSEKYKISLPVISGILKEVKIISVRLEKKNNAKKNIQA